MISILISKNVYIVMFGCHWTVFYIEIPSLNYPISFTGLNFVQMPSFSFVPVSIGSFNLDFTKMSN